VIRPRLLFAALLPLAAGAGVIHDASAGTWTIQSSTVEYRLKQNGKQIGLDYFGPVGAGSWPASEQRNPAPRFETFGLAEGEELSPERMSLSAQEIRQVRPGVDELRLLWKHDVLPLEVEARYTAWGNTGVISRKLAVVNRGQRAVHIESLPALHWRLPKGEYSLTYLWGGWGQERQVATEPIRAGRRAFVSDRGRSTALYSPWFAVHNEGADVTYIGQLAWSGNWQMNFERTPGRASAPPSDQDLRVELGMRFDFGGALAVARGARFELPEVAFTAATGGLDDAANRMHRYQREYVMPKTPANDPALVQFNSWYPFQGKMTVAEMKRCADVASRLGAEVFVLDAGWYNKKDWSRELGDYQADPVAFPHGIEELSEYVRAKGMKFGIWVEIENAGTESQLFRDHPDWFLAYDGRPVLQGSRHQLDFSKPEVRRWADTTVDRLVHDYKLTWMKIDYNIDVGDRFDPHGQERSGDVLYRHLTNYYRWLDQARLRHPQLVIENCSSGGLRLDLGILAHSHTTWLSDEVQPKPSAQLGYGCTVEFAQEACNHWMVGENHNGDVKESDPGWWDYMLRVPMNGQYGISSRVFDWSPDLMKRAVENVALYKRLRGVIKGADVYHLTPPPAHTNPQGWMAIQYASPDSRRSVVMAYRLENGEGQRAFRLRGLDPARSYRVIQEGGANSVVQGVELASRGLTLQLDADWRSAVVELQAVE
jgi:alpha-galactosidase